MATSLYFGASLDPGCGHGEFVQPDEIRAKIAYLAQEDFALRVKEAILIVQIARHNQRNISSIGAVALKDVAAPIGATSDESLANLGRRYGRT
jgi:hypothetical protein